MNYLSRNHSTDCLRFQISIGDGRVSLLTRRDKRYEPSARTQNMDHNWMLGDDPQSNHSLPQPPTQKATGNHCVLRRIITSIDDNGNRN